VQARARACVFRDDLRIDAIALLTHQRFAAELEENALEAH
jgi:hypothetical protein